jgi:FkbM family methyltransferase
MTRGDRVAGIVRRLQHAALAKFPRLAWKLWHLKNNLKRDDEFEVDFIRSIDSYIDSPRRTAIDIGANFGAYTMILSRQFRTVHSVEPLPTLAKPLRESGPRNCVVHQMALGSKAGELELFVPHSNAKGAVFAMTTAEASRFEGTAGSGVAPEDAFNRVERLVVPMQTFDAEFGQIDDIDFIKMDVEGSELSVLQGGRTTLARQQPVMLIEAEKQCGDACFAIFALLEELGYSPYYFRDGRMHRTDKSILDTMGDYLQTAAKSPEYRRYRDPKYIYNFIFAPPGRVRATV